MIYKGSKGEWIVNNVMEKKIMLRNYKFYMERVDFVKDYYEFPIEKVVKESG